jgi:ABC-type transporter Mla MlaB component
MLRITEIETDRDATYRTIKLEGKLLQPWVAELNQACLSCTNGERTVQLDLSAVIYMDQAGIEAVRDLRRRGVRVAACSDIVAELLHEEES